MKIDIILNDKPRIDKQEIEIVERKGFGHPDTLADGVADVISYKYAQYCLNKFGYILHHNVDKIALLGGQSRAGFGFGSLLKPMRVLINGRMSTSFGGEEIPIFEIARSATKEFLSNALPTINTEHDLDFYDFLNRAAGNPHKGQKWFRPESVDDLPEVWLPRAGDTACLVSYWPYSKMEHLAENIEKIIFYDKPFQPKYPHIGFDIKTMIVRKGKRVSVTMCIPFIGEKTPSLVFYKSEKERLKTKILAYVENYLGVEYNATVDLNTRDNEDIGDLFVLAKGTALESGDEGIVGRGNRSVGFIPSVRPYTVEAPNGKNPTYFVGKVYDYYTRILARKISTALDQHVNVYMMAQTGTALENPSQFIVEVEKGGAEVSRIIKDISDEELKKTPKISSFILAEVESKYPFLTDYK
ncbi:MAG: methionine adenosyltransferase [Candidatus Uhrbacteria bacterium]|nr:methionine adenosyltransferase [Candidatus Uhrbacteria bacterium]